MSSINKNIIKRYLTGYGMQTMIILITCWSNHPDWLVLIKFENILLSKLISDISAHFATFN